MGHLVRRCRRRRLCSVNGSGTTEANYLLGNFELLIFIAQTFELESKHAAGGGSKLPSDHSADSGHYQVANCAAQYRQRFFGEALECSHQLLPDRALYKSRGLLEQFAKELLQLRFIRNR